MYPSIPCASRARRPSRLRGSSAVVVRADNIVVDVTRYDPLAYSAPQHTVGMFTRASEYQVPVFNECVSTNNVYHDDKGRIGDVAPGQPGYKDIFDLTPWYTEWTKAEAAKKAGRAPRAP